MRHRPRVLVVARSYPNDVFPTLGLWIARPNAMLAESCDMTVVSPVPYCPPLPSVGPLRQYTRFRGIAARESRDGVRIIRPRFFAGTGRTLYRHEARLSFEAARRRTDELHAAAPFDLVHAHFIYPEGATAHRLARRYGIPLVVTEHAPWTDGWFKPSSVRDEALAAGRAAAQLLPVSTSVRATMVERIGERPGMHVIPVGVDESFFRLAPREGRQRGQILFVGFINRMKGIDVLLQAMSLLAETHPSARLLLAGGAFYRDTKRQEEELRGLADSLKLGDRVTFLGIRSPTEIGALMRESAVVVLPSRAESFGSVLVEALASGTPVVATRCGGPEDIVTDAVGRLVPIEDPPALADALGETIDGQDNYLPEDLRQHALQFSLRSVVTSIESAYDNALRERPT